MTAPRVWKRVNGKRAMQTLVASSKRTRLDEAYELYLARRGIDRHDVTDALTGTVRSLLAEQFEKDGIGHETAVQIVIAKTIAMPTLSQRPA